MVFCSKWRRLTMICIALALLLTGVGAGYAYYQHNLATIYHVYVDGHHIGPVSDPSQIEEWLDEKLVRASEKYPHVDLYINNEINLQEEERYKPVVNRKAVLDKLDEMVNIQARAVKILVEGELVGYASSEDLAEEVIETFKLNYVDKDVLLALEENKNNKARVTVAAVDASAQKPEESEQTTLDVCIKEHVQYEQATVNPDLVLDKENLAKRLAEPRTEQKTYTVQEGDVLGSIAEKFNMSLAQLLALNPGVDEDTLLQIGQELTVQGEEPVLTVVTVERMTEEQTIPYQVETKKDPDLYRGQTRVEREGKEGKKLVEFEVVKENGQVVSREVIDETVLEEPVNKIVVRGEKVKPSRGSGQFTWPARGGRITSGFGMRWGRPHNGIDIAGVSDRTIVAADNGTVVKAGWHSGGYGNTVIINHNNGYRTLYAHLASVNVRPGQTVQRGEAIGVMGSTGNSTGVHLHFEVHRNGAPVNPASYVR
ncbi:murein DD-endopeptidase MepM/ murein hydrolase activator NlpD [Caldalkalibacillus uzonensis]|uniref:Murein DD-endopeptidase MepM/ murein hydrolase activator NlpD n=1 Tax=Caldalkalibacillus uzonensis TaxID=353224 RepID=A0ABU0CSD3_9BACI|nr:peptidoglycan DD-metalloendopeptidase family protein [Caldalkalibacillus uzonensis]MDQ0339305.1 murein DD-endopeptidase MepM/ murein hydrolase activator NlpD [Caldalkalibacillus uzonensis]